MSTTLDCKDIGIGKSEFVTKTQFLSNNLHAKKGNVRLTTKLN